MKNNRLLILGLGSIGKRYSEIVKKNKNFDIFTFDINKKKTDFVSLEKIKTNKISCALICLPTYLHSRYIIKLISYGIKYILVEKPISNNFYNLNKIKKLVRKKKTKIFVVTNMRYHPGVEHLKLNIHMVGKIFFVRSYFENNLNNMYGKKLKGHYSNFHDLGGGVLFDACHEIDYLKYIIGPIKKSCSVAFADKSVEATDIFYSIITHKNNVISSINSNFLSKSKSRGCEIYGEKGNLIWSSKGKPGRERISVNFFSKNNKKRKIFRCINFDHNEPYLRQIKEFKFMKTKKKFNMSNLNDALDTLKTLLNTKIYGIKKIKKIS